MILKVEFNEESSNFKAEVSENTSTFKADIIENNSSVNVDFGQVFRIANDEVPIYEGEYSVTPAVNEQTIETAYKMMSENVTVEKIPYFEVSNNSGGMTATIAS